jgi:uncharacterized protein (TIGR03790 family)
MKWRLVINDDDPLSRLSGEYYRDARKIPPGNLIRVRFPPGRSALPVDEFAVLKARIDRATPAHVQAYAVAWTRPYRVGCMSLTSALAFGFDPAFCSSACGATRPSPYFDSGSRYPAAEHAMRPAMMLAGTDFEQVRRLIDRGLAADRSFPSGKVWLLSTSDKARNVRAAHFERTAAALAGVFPVEVREGNAIGERGEVLGYFTGLAQVPDLATLQFLPGALADHLTSFGGQLTDSSQMSSLRWLEAGATASYGTVVEPCSHPQKFPLPAIALFHYADRGHVRRGLLEERRLAGRGCVRRRPAGASLCARCCARLPRPLRTEAILAARRQAGFRTFAFADGALPAPGAAAVHPSRPERAAVRLAGRDGRLPAAALVGCEAASKARQLPGASAMPRGLARSDY